MTGFFKQNGQNSKMSFLLSEFVTEQELLQKEVISPDDVLRLPKITEGKYK